MPACSTAKHPSGVSITFTEADHKYKSVIDGKELTYVSGTQFLGSYYPPFDPSGRIAEACARREGLTVEALKAKWDAKRDRSCRLGTRMHERIEDCLLGNPARNQPEDDEEKTRFENAVKMAEGLKSRLNILGVEKIVFSPDLRIAGTIDLFARSRTDGTYLIVDHKSNEKIDFTSPYGKCRGPIAHLDDCSFFHYALQLALYSYLLKYGKYVPYDAKFRCFINHVTPKKAQLIELPDMSIEIRDLVIDWLLKGGNRE